MDHYSFIASTKLSKRMPQQLMMRILVAALALGYVSTLLLRALLPSVFEADGSEDVAFMQAAITLTLVFGVLLYLVVRSRFIASGEGLDGPVPTELWFEEGLVRIAYHGIDRDDGRGPHDEELALAPKDIKGLRYQRNERGGVVTLVHRSQGAGWQEERWGLDRMDESSRGDLLDRLDRYAREYLGLLGIMDPVEGHRGRRGGVDRTTEPIARAPDLVELDADPEGRRRVLHQWRWDATRRFLLTAVVLTVIEAALGAIAGALGSFDASGSSGDDSSSALETVILLAMVAALIILIVALLLFLVRYSDCSRRIGRQRVLVGQDRMVFVSVEGHPVCTDPGDDVPCIKRISGYEVGELRIMVRGRFVEKIDGFDEDGREVHEVRDITEFSISRIHQREDELLACLDRLEQV